MMPPFVTSHPLPEPIVTACGLFFRAQLALYFTSSTRMLCVVIWPFTVLWGLTLILPDARNLWNTPAAASHFQNERDSLLVATTNLMPVSARSVSTASPGAA